MENESNILDFPVAVWVSVEKSWTERNWAVTFGSGSTALKVLIWAPKFWIVNEGDSETEKNLTLKERGIRSVKEHFLTWHKRLNLEALTNSDTELQWGCRAKCLPFKTSCPAEAFYSLFLIWRNWAEIQSYDVWFINLLHLICQESQSITRSTDVSSWQPVISGCSEVIFLLDFPCERFQIHHYTISHFMPSCYFRSRN